MATFIGRDSIENIANRLHTEVVMGPATFRPDVFTRMKINVLTGVQFKDVKYVLARKGHTTRRKTVGDTVNSQVGYMQEREMVAHLTWNKYTDNKDNYVETPIVDATNTGAFSYPASELAVRAILMSYSEDLYDCLFHGDADIDATDVNAYLRLYDGFLTMIGKDIEKGDISKLRKNLVELDAISAPTSSTDIGAFTEFKEFYNGWTSALRNASEVLVYGTPETLDYIATAYGNSKGNISGVTYKEDGTFKIPQYANVSFVPESGLGSGDKLIATIPFNFEYGIDTLDARTNVMIKEGSDNDLNDIIFQIQSIQGTRVVNINPSVFCVSDGSLTAEGQAGDYRKNSFTVVSSSATMGDVEVDDETPDNNKEYAAGTSIELKATAKSGYEFVNWVVNGKVSTTNPLTVVTKAQPSVAVATFRATT